MGFLKRRTLAPVGPPPINPKNLRVAMMDDASLYTFVESGLMSAGEYLTRHRQGQDGAAAFALDALAQAQLGLEEMKRRSG